MPLAATLPEGVSPGDAAWLGFDPAQTYIYADSRLAAGEG